MTHDLIDPAIALMKGQRFGEALHLLRRVIDQDPSHWNAWYMAGQKKAQGFALDMGQIIRWS